MSKNIDSSVYVDTSALESWGAKMSSINGAAMQHLTQFLSQVHQLEGSWAGSSATAFLNSSETFISNSKQCHENMSDVHQFLEEVIAVMEKE